MNQKIINGYDIVDNEKYVRYEEYLDFLKQQPPAGDLTTEIRNALKVQTRLNPKQERKAITICDRLDRAEAELKAKDELIFAYESVRAPINPLLSENRRLKKTIEDYGNNPAGFDWAVLEKIENIESINADLLAALEEASTDFYYIHQHPEDAHTDSYNFMEKAKAAISKAEQ